jgi:hypothetical protein
MLVEYLDGDMQGESSNTVAKVKNLEVLKKNVKNLEAVDAVFVMLRQFRT